MTDDARHRAGAAVAFEAPHPVMIRADNAAYRVPTKRRVATGSGRLLVRQRTWLYRDCTALQGIVMLPFVIRDVMSHPSSFEQGRTTGLSVPDYAVPTSGPFMTLVDAPVTV
jgi:hypothetical protein